MDINSDNVYDIIRKTLSIANQRIITHGEITGYIFLKMLECENVYTKQDMLDYTMTAILHDIGIYKVNERQSLREAETKNIWAHSIYGYLFLKYLSPIGDRAEMVLYHHLPYIKLCKIQSRYRRVTEYLQLADKMDNFLHLKDNGMDSDYFTAKRDTDFSGAALDLFIKAEKRFGITTKLKSDAYLQELNSFLATKSYTEEQRKGFLQMLVYTIDFRSEHTVIHTLATVSFAMSLGRLVKLPSKDLKNLYYGSLLHDVGKLAIPIQILEAPRKLTPGEMKVMKAHVRISEMILDGVVDDEICQIAIRHHEKMDGSGYHRGLTANDLTVPQQIVAVADIISALYGKRSYKEAFDSSLIIKIISEDAANNKISKSIVEIAIRNFKTIMAEFEKQKTTTMGMYMTIKEQYDVIYERFKEFEVVHEK